MLREKIKILYPMITDVEINRFIKIENNSDGNGPYIVKWDHPEFDRPTKEQLDSISDTSAQKLRLKQSGELMIQKILDTTAQEYGYDNILTAISYAMNPAVSKYMEEGQAFGDWRSLMWEKFYQLIEDDSVTTLDDIRQSLPEINI
jgi:hypothetical protein